MFTQIKSAASNFQNKLSAYHQNQNGSVALIFAFMVPTLFVTVGMTVDYGIAKRTHTELQATTDAAALAAAQGTHLNTEQRIEVANTIFNANFKVNSRVVRPTPNISVDADGKVYVSAKVNVNTSFLKIIEVKTIPVSTNSSAIAINPQPICLLALNKTMDRAIEIGGTGSLEAVNCAVQANSTSDNAIYAGGSSRAKAEDFCSPGGYVGNNFSPRPKRCYAVEDPYAGLEFPYSGKCDHYNKRVKRGDGTVILNPGKYCGGIDIGVHATVRLSPGQYIISGGDFSIGSHSNIAGSDVAIFLIGNNTGIDIDGGAVVSLSAPTEGEYEGFLFIQDPDSNPDHLNTINGGGDIKMVGTLYLPTQGVHITGNGAFGINSPMMPIIADHFIVDGNGIFQVDLDEANMDIKLPMTNDGAVVMY